MIGAQNLHGAVVAASESDPNNAHLSLSVRHQSFASSEETITKVIRCPFWDWVTKDGDLCLHQKLSLSDASCLLVVMKPAALLWATPWGGPHGGDLRAASCWQPMRTGGPHWNRDPQSNSLWETQFCQRPLISFESSSFFSRAFRWNCSPSQHLDYSTIRIPDPQKLWENKCYFEPLSLGIIF